MPSFNGESQAPSLPIFNIYLGIKFYNQNDEFPTVLPFDKGICLSVEAQHNYHDTVIFFPKTSQQWSPPRKDIISDLITVLQSTEMQISHLKHLPKQWHVHAESPPGEADIYSTVHMELTILKQFLLLLLYPPNLKQPQFQTHLRFWHLQFHGLLNQTSFHVKPQKSSFPLPPPPPPQHMGRYSQMTSFIQCGMLRWRRSKYQIWK